jgi:hypothetical protein
MHQLGVIFLEMLVSWLSPDTESASEVLAECIASSHFIECLQDLLLARVLRGSQVSSEVVSQLESLLDGLLHADPWERLECFQIEEAISATLDLLNSTEETSTSS